MANKVIELTDELVSRLKSRKELKTALDTDEWTPIQVLFQEIQVACEIDFVANGVRRTIKEQIELLKAKIQQDFEDDEELKEALLKSIPGYCAVTIWTRSDNWKKAVQEKIRSTHVFSNENQLRVLENLLKTATAAGGGGGSVKAIELYFRLEGSLGSEKKESEKDATYERYKNLQKTLHKK